MKELVKSAIGLEPLKLWDILATDRIDVRAAFGEKIAHDLFESTKFKGATAEQTMFRLLNITSFALGRHCVLVDGGYTTRPMLYTCIVAPSGATKSPVSKWLQKNNVDRWSYQFAQMHAQFIQDVDKRTKTETGKDGEERERLLNTTEAQQARKELH